MESHLKSCAQCSALKRDLELLVKLARSDMRVEAPANFDRLLQQRVNSVLAGARPWALPLAWGAATVVAFTLIFFFNIIPRLQRPEFPEPTQTPRLVSLGEPNSPVMHVFVPGEQKGMVVRVPTTVKITDNQLTQDFFLSEVSH